MPMTIDQFIRDPAPRFDAESPRTIAKAMTHRREDGADVAASVARDETFTRWLRDAQRQVLAALPPGSTVSVTHFVSVGNVNGCGGNDASNAWFTVRALVGGRLFVNSNGNLGPAVSAVIEEAKREGSA